MRSPEEGWQAFDEVMRVGKAMAAELEGRIKAAPSNLMSWEKAATYYCARAVHGEVELDKAQRELADLKQAVRDHIKKEYYTPGMCTTAALIKLVKELP